MQLATPDGFRDRFWAGVNLGATTPGHLPGEVSARGARGGQRRPARAPRRGLAYGRWTADIRPWIVAWSPGVE